jgi:hypothetical protein
MKTEYLIYINIFILILILYKKYQENYNRRVNSRTPSNDRVENTIEDYKNEPYITVFAKFGLCNRLQVVLSYLYKANLENKKLKIYWITDDECPEIYSNLFQSIDNVEFEYINDDKDIDIYDYVTYQRENQEYIFANYYQYLKPLPEIQNIIDKYKKLLNSNIGYISCHIRKTDSLSHYDHLQDKAYMDFINQYDPTLKIYIATDNKETQDIFKNVYRDRLVIKDIISSNNLRQTSLQDAVIDIYVCAGSTYFMGTNGSTFTNTIDFIAKRYY